MRTQVFCSVGLLRATIAPPKFQKPTVLGWFFFAYIRQYWRGFRAWPRERQPSDPSIFTPAHASLFSVLSGGLASVREATPRNHAGCGAVSCG